MDSCIALIWALENGFFVVQSSDYYFMLMSPNEGGTGAQLISAVRMRKVLAIPPNLYRVLLAVFRLWNLYTVAKFTLSTQ